MVAVETGIQPSAGLEGTGGLVDGVIDHGSGSNNLDSMVSGI
jgi:hypothetical protein